MGTVTVVDDPGALTPEWMTWALGQSGLDAVVVDAVAERVGTGQIGASYRVRLTYADDAPGAPESVVVKMGFGDAAARGRVAQGFVKEVGFYRSLASTVGIRRPHLWYGDISEATTEFTLVLEDLSAARPGVQARGCSFDQALDAVRNVAHLHAPRWCDVSLFEYEFLAPPDAATADFIGELLVGATEDFITRYDAVIDAADRATLREAARANATWHAATPKEFGLVHGDYRLDNLMFPSEGPGVRTLDWQTLTIGQPVRDVAYFLGNSLVTEQRRAEEERLVAAYHSELVAAGVGGYSADQCWADYRLGQFQGPMITILGCVLATAQRSAASDEMFVVMATRSAAAIRDLDSLSLV